MIAFACPGCAAPMRSLPLPAADGRTLALDHCAPCRLVWFDAFELGALGHAGWAALLLRMAEAGDGGAIVPPSSLLPRTGRCPRCDAKLEPDHNRTRFGRFSGLACPRGHGEARRDGALLASRGLFRQLLPIEYAALEREGRALACQSCGAALARGARACSHCDAPVVAVDLPRLAAALGLRDATDLDGQAGPPDATAPRLWSCHGCGAALDPTRQAACVQCRHPVVAPQLGDLRPLFAAALARAPVVPGGALAHGTAAHAGDTLPGTAVARRLWKREPRAALRSSSRGSRGLEVLMGLVVILLALAWLVGPR
jgi:hypothetical protein